MRAARAAGVAARRAIERARWKAVGGARHDGRAGRREALRVGDAVVGVAAAIDPLAVLVGLLKEWKRLRRALLLALLRRRKRLKLALTLNRGADGRSNDARGLRHGRILVDVRVTRRQSKAVVVDSLRVRKQLSAATARSRHGSSARRLERGRERVRWRVGA
ncbi:hypothetical protein IWZ00DRAFT_498268 [Phyllosticta capitalensis]